MSKVIAVWGNPGAGKTTFCCLLARRLTRDKSKAILLSPDTATPVFPALFPGEEIPTRQSLGNLLSAPQINNAQVAGCVVLYKPYPFVGVLGFTAGETPLSYDEPEYRRIKELFRLATGLVDYLIIDCTASVVSPFTPAAIESADVTVRILSANLFGLSYFKAHQPLLSDPRFRLEEQISLAGQARPFQAIEEAGHQLGGYAGLLPYNKELERSGCCGELFASLDRCGQRYMKSLNLVAKAVNPAAAEDMEAEDAEQFE